MKILTLEEKYRTDILTDNIALDKYRQCRDCILQSDGTVYSNHYQKGCCAMYPYPQFKPREIMLGERICSFYKPKQQLEIHFKKIYERDMDFLILEEFISDKKFACLFLNKIGLTENYVITSAAHSQADTDGESDIIFVLQFPTQKVALLIEDKIDAPTMPEQSQRYHKRARTDMEAHLYDTCHTILVAPSEYLISHQNDPNANFQHHVSYEELLSFFSSQKTPRATFKASLIQQAISEQKQGYQVIENESVTNFWIRLRKYCKDNYPNLAMLGEDTPKGISARWPEFRTALRNIKIIYKSQKGYVDLEFPGYGNRTGDLYAIVGNQMTNSMCIRETGKSASIRLANDHWKTEFYRDFDSQQAIIDEVLQAVSLLCDLAANLNYADFY